MAAEKANNDKANAVEEGELLNLAKYDDLKHPFRLKSNDGFTTVVEREYVLGLSGVIREKCTEDKNIQEYIFEGNGGVLALVTEFINHHKGIPPASPEKPVRSKIMREVCTDPWDADFIDNAWNNGKQNVYDLAKITCKLDMMSLCNLACAKFAAVIKGVPSNKMKELLASPQAQ